MPASEDQPNSPSNIRTGRLQILMRKSFSLILTAIALMATSAFAQTRARGSAANDSLSFLPKSDGIMVFDTRRLLNETLPQVFAGDSAKLTQINSEIDHFKTQTGVDPRLLNRLVLGTRYVYPEPGMTKFETVVIARGTFDPKAIAAAGKVKAQGRYREEKYRGATIMIFSINDQMRWLGLWNMKVSDLAVSAVDVKTLAIGSPVTVRAAISAGRAGVPSNAALLALATRDPSAVIGFGGNLTPQLTANLNVGTDAMAADVRSIRQVYGSLGSAQTNLSFTLVARTDTATWAKNLSDTVTGLKQLGAILILRMTGPRKALAESALANLKITTQANEMQIRTEVPANSLASIMK
jgi:hypothetical protein